MSATDIGGVLARMWSSLPRERAEELFEEGMALSTDDALTYATRIDA